MFDKRRVEIRLRGDGQLEHHLDACGQRVEPRRDGVAQQRFAIRLVGRLDRDFRLDDRDEAVRDDLFGQLELLRDDRGDAGRRGAVDDRAHLGAENPFADRAVEQLGQIRDRLHQRDAIRFGREPFVDLQDRHDAALLPQIGRHGLALGLPVHRRLEQDRGEHFGAGEGRRRHDPHAHLMDEREHLGLALVGVFGNAVLLSAPGVDPPL